jgi:hypothetical protein
MESGLWALAGVAVGGLINLLLWSIQFKAQRIREDRQLAALKIEELSRILTNAERILKMVTSQSIRAPSLVELWRDKDPWAELDLIQARSMVAIYFSHVVDAFDAMQMHILAFSRELQELMGSGALDKSSLSAHYPAFVNARNLVLEHCMEKIWAVPKKRQSVAKKA